MTTIEQLADFWSETPARIRQLVTGGIIEQDADGGFNATDATKKYIKFLNDELKKKSGKHAVGVALDQKKLEAEIRIKEAKALQEELKLKAMGVGTNAERENTENDNFTFKTETGTADISRYIGISAQQLSRMLLRLPDTPQKTKEGKYVSRDVLKWYYMREAVRVGSTNTREKTQEEELRLKKIKADMAEGKVIECGVAYDFLSKIYVTTWETLKANAKNFGKEEKSAIKTARTMFESLRKELQSIGAKANRDSPKL